MAASASLGRPLRRRLWLSPHYYEFFKAVPSQYGDRQGQIELFGRFAGVPVLDLPCLCTHNVRYHTTTLEDDDDDDDSPTSSSMSPNPVTMAFSPARSFAAVAAAAAAAKANPNAPRATRGSAGVAANSKAIDLTGSPEQGLNDLEARRAKVAAAKKARDVKKQARVTGAKPSEKARKGTKSEKEAKLAALRAEQAVQRESIRLSRAARAREKAEKEAARAQKEKEEMLAMDAAIQLVQREAKELKGSGQDDVEAGDGADVGEDNDGMDETEGMETDGDMNESTPSGGAENVPVEQNASTRGRGRQGSKICVGLTGKAVLASKPASSAQPKSPVKLYRGSNKRGQVEQAVAPTPPRADAPDTTWVPSGRADLGGKTLFRSGGEEDEGDQLADYFLKGGGAEQELADMNKKGEQLKAMGATNNSTPLVQNNTAAKASTSGTTAAGDTSNPNQGQQQAQAQADVHSNGADAERSEDSDQAAAKSSGKGVHSTPGAPPAGQAPAGTGSGVSFHPGSSSSKPAHTPFRFGRTSGPVQLPGGAVTPSTSASTASQSTSSTLHTSSTLRSSSYSGVRHNHIPVIDTDAIGASI